MAHIRLRINNKEYELEGSEEFIARMEPKLTAFLEKYAMQGETPLSRSVHTQTHESDFGDANRAADEAYIRRFLERYNNFNDFAAGNT